MIMTRDLLRKFRKLLESRSRGSYTSQGLYEAIKCIILEYVDNIGADRNVIVWKPSIINTGYSSPIGNFGYFRCPRCGRIFSVDEARNSGFRCAHCDIHLVQAYVGAPVEFSQQFRPLEVPASGGGNPIPIFASVADIIDIWCPLRKGFKGLRPEDPIRPLATLRFTCPYNDNTCKYYLADGWCNHRKYIIFPKMRGGGRRIPSSPSEGLTKPFTITIFDKIGEHEYEDIGDDIGFTNLGKAYYGRFKVWHLTLFYMVGSPYLPRGLRRAVVIVDDNNNLIVTGRRMEVEGILLELDFNKVKEVAEENNTTFYTVAHSVSHALMKAVVRVSGLSYHEFGEAVYVDENEGKAEVLIYDDSPGGVGGVKAFKSAGLDACFRIQEAVVGCPRACMLACRACLFLENCGELNYNLSWRAAQHYLAELSCQGYSV